MAKKVIPLQIEKGKVLCNSDIMEHTLNVQAPQITGYRKRGLIVQPSHGTYDLIETVRRVIDANRRQPASEETHDFQVEKARLTKAQADKAEMEVMELSGSLVRTEDVVEEWQSQLMDMKGKLLSIPSKLATLVADIDNPSEVQSLIDDYIREALQELAAYAGDGKHTAEPTISEDGAKATTKANSKPVGRPRKKAGRAE
jgi:phage terminase Nu1 subunit (DNA packaging protein)